MKLFSKILICFCVFVLVREVNAESFSAKYKVSTKNITIGELFWDLNKNDKTYKLNIELKSRGLLSSVFRFSGSYTASGSLKEGAFVPHHYTQEWLTKKKKRDVQITFEKNKVSLLSQQPAEKELSRIDIDLLRGYVDPLTSFIKLLSGVPQSKTIDGRRVYILALIKEEENKNTKTYSIREYKNIWADHKRNDLEEITIISRSNNYLPEAIYINFKGRVFGVLKV